MNYALHNKYKLTGIIDKRSLIFPEVLSHYSMIRHVSLKGTQLHTYLIQTRIYVVRDK